MFYDVAMVDFALYLGILCVVLFLFLLLCVRISVYIEDTCPFGICASRKQVKRRDTMVRQLLYPDQSVVPGLAGAAPPSDENITEDIICQPYIYRDTFSTGLSGLSIMTHANRPLAVGYSEDGQPYDAIVAKSADNLDLKFCSSIPPHPVLPSNTSAKPPPAPVVDSKRSKPQNDETLLLEEDTSSVAESSVAVKCCGNESKV